MSDKNNNILVVFVLVVMLIVTALSFSKEPEKEHIPIEFYPWLDLTDDQAIKALIASYLVNRDDIPDAPIRMTPINPPEGQDDITISLGDIGEVNMTYRNALTHNKTRLTLARSFKASYIDNAGNKISIKGWVGENGKIKERELEFEAAHQ